MARFKWKDAPNDVASILYETVIPPEERRQLGEYYTPGRMVQTMVREMVPDPLDQTVLDPSCGSGTFVAEAVTHVTIVRRELRAWLRKSSEGAVGWLLGRGEALLMGGN